SNQSGSKRNRKTVRGEPETQQLDDSTEAGPSRSNTTSRTPHIGGSGASATAEPATESARRPTRAPTRSSEQQLERSRQTYRRSRARRAEELEQLTDARSALLRDIGMLERDMARAAAERRAWLETEVGYLQR
ncbi:hypothetical protein HK405_008380, partial [Cladochytrium tenue]